MFATPAFAQAGSASTAGGMAFFMQIAPLLFIFVIFWFLVFRPQQQRVKQQRARIDAAKKGDSVVTGGGLVGKITKSAKLTTSAIALVTAGGVSMTTSLKPAARASSKSCTRFVKTEWIKAGVAASRQFHHFAKLPCGSVSISATGPAPAISACTPICPASVVLPDPPFCEAKTITRIVDIG